MLFQHTRLFLLFQNFGSCFNYLFKGCNLRHFPVYFSEAVCGVDKRHSCKIRSVTVALRISHIDSFIKAVTFNYKLDILAFSLACSARALKINKVFFKLWVTVEKRLYIAVLTIADDNKLIAFAELFQRFFKLW